MLAALAARARYIVNEADAEIFDAMNKGVALASHEQILFLNVGDELADSGSCGAVALTTS